MNPQETPQLTPMQRKAVGRKLLEAEIIARAWADDAFRAKLEADPASALSEAGLPLPKDKTIKVITETQDSLTLVIPPAPEPGEEADDSELSAVSGGGLIDTGRCSLYEDIGDTSGLYGVLSPAVCVGTIAITAFMGISWGWN